MLRGEGNDNGKKITTIGLIGKKGTLHVQHTFLCISLPLFCTTTTWNFQEILSYNFFGENVVRVLVRFFFSLPLIFNLYCCPLAVVTAAAKFSCCSSNKKNVSFVFFIFCSRCLSPFISLSLAGLPPTFFFSLSFSCSIFQICGHDN